MPQNGHVENEWKTRNLRILHSLNIEFDTSENVNQSSSVYMKREIFAPFDAWFDGHDDTLPALRFISLFDEFEDNKVNRPLEEVINKYIQLKIDEI